MKILGAPKEGLTMTVRHTGKKYRFKPAVVKGLAMDANLSGPWLKAHKWDQIHSKGTLRIEGRDVPLSSRLQHGKDTDATDVTVHAVKKTTIP